MFGWVEAGGRCSVIAVCEFEPGRRQSVALQPRHPSAATNVFLVIRSPRYVTADYRDFDPGSIQLRGFFRDVSGTLTFPVELSRSIATQLLGVNDVGLITGNHTDGSGVVHGLLVQTPKHPRASIFRARARRLSTASIISGLSPVATPIWPAFGTGSSRESARSPGIKRKQRRALWPGVSRHSRGRSDRCCALPSRRAGASCNPRR
jgi:hypothetical protein